ncbi:hypothetical protein KTO58_01555 [Chitinophaga pendula]|uniref:hypothetical protein n=1 Tax=Chitinophaga TaxID=79328 RepID=UPI0012FDCA1C|nr:MULTISPECIES: hypothetical protein [Chitinophaga]UCJ07891.1 hypothetical protein KTO58_01555 [Chitinophaga pendula]
MFKFLFPTKKSSSLSTIDKSVNDAAQSAVKERQLADRISFRRGMLLSNNFHCVKKKRGFGGTV